MPKPQATDLSAWLQKAEEVEAVRSETLRPELGIHRTARRRPRQMPAAGNVPVPWGGWKYCNWKLMSNVGLGVQTGGSRAKPR